MANGKRQPAVRSRPHNYRFDLWQHFCSQLLRTRQAQNKKKRNPKRKSHGMCLFPCPCHCCRPRADSMPSLGLRASEITFITDKGGPSCSCYRRAKARHLQLSIQCRRLHELKQTRFHQFQVEPVPQVVNTPEKLSLQKVRIIRASKEIVIQ